MTGLGYTLPAVVAVVLVCAWEFGWLRTGLLRRPAYWMSMVIVIGFQVLVDGWLTKLSAPIVVYDERHTSGIRFPWDIPVEDFLFGWALVTSVLLLWVRLGSRENRDDESWAGKLAGRRATSLRRSTLARPAMTPWLVQTRDIMCTFVFRRSACASPARAADCGCSTWDAAPVPRRRR
ncbi:MAG: hypothetical protein QOD90_4574 [Mycobacterium sp.]|nr:hypothetical protein [Mycobacterium sp.]